MILKTRFFNKKLFVLALIFAFFGKISMAQTGNADERAEKEIKEQFNVKETTFHHLLDNYNWEFGPLGKVSLPRIIWNQKSGKLDFFGSTDKAEESGYIVAHEFDAEAKHGDLLVPEMKEELEAKKAAYEHTSGADKATAQKELNSTINEARPYDFSITKNVLYIFFAAIIMLLVFTSVAKAYTRRPNSAPKGMQSFFEAIIVFIRDDVAKENIQHGYERFMPLLLTNFFFIWFLNMMGMIPFSGNVTGNISVTLSLSLITLIATNIYANKAYWKHIFWPPVPGFVKPIFIPVEILGIFTKPFALTIRLFANMTAGHVIVVSLLSLIFIFGKSGENAVAGYGVGIFSSAFIVAISLLEMFVAILQAFVFTMLTAVFIGQATAEEEHH